MYKIVELLDDKHALVCKSEDQFRALPYRVKKQALMSVIYLKESESEASKKTDPLKRTRASKVQLISTTKCQNKNPLQKEKSPKQVNNVVAADKKNTWPLPKKRLFPRILEMDEGSFVEYKKSEPDQQNELDAASDQSDSDHGFTDEDEETQQVHGFPLLEQQHRERVQLHYVNLIEQAEAAVQEEVDQQEAQHSNNARVPLPIHQAQSPPGQPGSPPPEWDPRSPFFHPLPADDPRSPLVQRRKPTPGSRVGPPSIAPFAIRAGTPRQRLGATANPVEPALPDIQPLPNQFQRNQVARNPVRRRQSEVPLQVKTRSATRQKPPDDWEEDKN